MKIKVVNIRRNGRAVPNQFIIHKDDDLVFQSYSSIILKLSNGAVTISKSWDYNKITLRHLKQLLNCTTKEIKGRIGSGMYKLVDELEI